MTTKSLKKLLACIGTYYVLQMIAGLIGGVVYAFYTTPLDLAPWLHLLSAAVMNNDHEVLLENQLEH